MLDPFMTGPLLEYTGSKNSLGGTLTQFAFVLLGDLRVLLLAIGVARPERSLRRNLLWALALSLVVPVLAGGAYGLARAIWPDIHGQTLWMIYEFGFLSLCILLSRNWVPRILAGGDANPHNASAIAFLRALFGFSAAYYALWWFADWIIVVGGLDLGWALRIVPNQLYYALWVPFVYMRFFSARRENAAV